MQPHFTEESGDLKSVSVNSLSLTDNRAILMYHILPSLSVGPGPEGSSYFSEAWKHTLQRMAGSPLFRNGAGGGGSAVVRKQAQTGY